MANIAKKITIDSPKSVADVQAVANTLFNRVVGGIGGKVTVLFVVEGLKNSDLGTVMGELNEGEKVSAIRLRKKKGD